MRDQLARNLDELHQHDNILGLYISDCADRMQWSDANAVVLKAAITVLKAYRDATRYRQVPIGVMKAGGLFSQPNMDFFDCGNETIAADFYSFAVTDLCSDTDFATSSFNDIVDMAGNFDVPVFMAGNTCSGSRSFSDQLWVFGHWSDRLSGNSTCRNQVPPSTLTVSVPAEWYNYFSTCAVPVSEMM